MLKQSFPTFSLILDDMKRVRIEFHWAYTAVMLTAMLTGIVSITLEAVAHEKDVPHVHSRDDKRREQDGGVLKPIGHNPPKGDLHCRNIAPGWSYDAKNRKCVGPTGPKKK